MQRVVLACVLLSGALVVPTLRAEDEPGGVPAVPAPGAPVVSPEEILGWVADLGRDDFRQREEAYRQLGQAGEAARAALESAAKGSESLEVRWRAQQLLLRLDGRAEKPMGSPEQSPRPGAVVPGRDDLRKLFEADTPEEVRELMDRLMQGFGRRGGWPGFQVAPLQGLEVFSTRLTSGDLTLKLSTFGPQRAELEVRGQDAAGLPTHTTHSGTSLEAILEANPPLKEHPSLPGLRQELESAKRRGALRLLDPGLRMPMFSFSTSEGIEFQHDASGVTVRVREKGPDGRLETKEYKGTSLAEIQKEHPELAERLRGFQVRVAPPRVFRGPKEEPLPSLPLPEPAPEVPSAVDSTRFGLLLEPVDALLSRHLRLEPGQAVLVREVLPGSQAASLGLEEFDILVSIDGRAIVSMDDAVLRLRSAAQAEAALTLVIIRSGQRQSLAR